jgi:hypothetical protein
MVVEAAVVAGAKVLLTENAGLLRAVDAAPGGLCAVDPFAPADRSASRSPQAVGLT